MTPVVERVQQALREAGVPFTVVEHAPVRTSEEAARVRGTPPEEGAKALVTGCVPGAVPPLGNLFGLRVYLDEQLTQRERVVFNAGSNAVSISMLSADLARVSAATVCRFARA